MVNEIIGRVMMTFTGEYSPTKKYTYLDSVLFKGSSYVCKVDATGIEPTDITHWQMIASKGGSGSVDSIKWDSITDKPELVTIKQMEDTLSNRDTTKLGSVTIEQVGSDVKPSGSFVLNDKKVYDLELKLAKNSGTDVKSSDWGHSNVSFLNGASAQDNFHYRTTDIGDLHIVQVSGWINYSYLAAYSFQKAVQLPIKGYETSNYYFSGGLMFNNNNQQIMLYSSSPNSIELYTYQADRNHSVPINCIFMY